MLLTDKTGKIVRPAAGEVHPGSVPATVEKLKQQTPTTPRGATVAPEVQQRIKEANAESRELEFLPGKPLPLQPYFGGTEQLGNTCLQPGSLLPSCPLSRFANDLKGYAQDGGLTYSIPMGYTFYNLSGTVPGGENHFNYWNMDARFNWAVFNAPQASSACWITTEVVGHLSLDAQTRSSTPQASAGSMLNPAGNIWGPNGIWLQQLAWQQSFANGKLVVVAGQVDQSNYLDFNSYAGNKNGQFLASPFVNSAVLPMPCNNLGLNIQWQPCESFYATIGGGPNNQTAGGSVWESLSTQDMSYLLELGYVAKNFLGLGPGTYRLQPFWVVANGTGQPGICFNLQQQLGKHSPVGYFARLGVAGADTAIEGTAATVATGFNVTGPLKAIGLAPKLSNDQFGVGFLWGQPGAALQPVVHDNEYAFEAFYTLQLTPTLTLLPDVQMIFNPVNNAVHDRVTQFALQLNLTW